MSKNLFTLCFALLVFPFLSPAQPVEFRMVYEEGFHVVDFIEQPYQGIYYLAFDSLAIGLTDSTASLVQSWRYDHPALGRFVGIEPTVGGKIVFGDGPMGMFLMKIDSLGQPLWLRTYGGLEGRSIHPSPDGGFLLLGAGSGLPKILLTRVDVQGMTIWSKAIKLGSSNQTESPAEAIWLETGRIVITGTLSRANGPDLDGFLLKLDSSGTVLYQDIMRSDDFRSCEPLCLAPGPNSSFIMGGSVKESLGEYAFQARFDQENLLTYPAYTIYFDFDFNHPANKTVAVAYKYDSDPHPFYNELFYVMQVPVSANETDIIVQKHRREYYSAQLISETRFGVGGIDEAMKIQYNHWKSVHISGKTQNNGQFNSGGFLRKISRAKGTLCDGTNSPISSRSFTNINLVNVGIGILPGPAAITDSLPTVTSISIFNDSTCWSVDVDEPEEEKWTVWPNPAPGNFNLSAPALINGAELRLFDASGREIWQKRIELLSGDLSLPLPGPAGLYFLEITTEKGRTLKKVLNQP